MHIFGWLVFLSLGSWSLVQSKPTTLNALVRRESEFFPFLRRLLDDCTTYLLENHGDQLQPPLMSRYMTLSISRKKSTSNSRLLQATIISLDQMSLQEFETIWEGQLYGRGQFDMVSSPEPMDSWVVPDPFDVEPDPFDVEDLGATGLDEAIAISTTDPRARGTWWNKVFIAKTREGEVRYEIKLCRGTRLAGMFQVYAAADHGQRVRFLSPLSR